MKIFIFFAAFSCSFVVFAQDGSLAEENTPNTIEQLELDSNLVTEESGIEDEGKLVLEKNVAEEDKEEEDSNSRFVPTEQISQDLGVSFPVDI